jgi:hypothetical protein
MLMPDLNEFSIYSDTFDLVFLSLWVFWSVELWG